LSSSALAVFLPRLTCAGPLRTCIRRGLVDDDFVYLAKLAKILVPFEHLRVGQPHGEADDENEIPLHHPDAGQVLPALAQLGLPLLVPLPLLSLQLGHLFLGERREVGGVLGVGLAARRTQSVLVGADSVPAEPTDL
jgi:hypothetical protein